MPRRKKKRESRNKPLADECIICHGIGELKISSRIVKCAVCKGTGYIDKKQRFKCPRCDEIVITDAGLPVICSCGLRLK